MIPQVLTKSKKILTKKIPDHLKTGTLIIDCWNQMTAQPSNSLVDKIRKKTARDRLTARWAFFWGGGTWQGPIPGRTKKRLWLCHSAVTVLNQNKFIKISVIIKSICIFNSMDALCSSFYCHIYRFYMYPFDDRNLHSFFPCISIIFKVEVTTFFGDIFCHFMIFLND